MSAYVLGGKGVVLSQNRLYLEIGSYALLLVAVWLNIIGLNVGKWLQNAGGVATYLPLLMLAAVAGIVWVHYGSVAQFTCSRMLPVRRWDTMNLGSQLTCAFT